MSERKYQAGFYKGRGVAGSEQHGYSRDGGGQISIDVDVQISDQEVARLTTILAFAGKGGPISIDRLKALGWDGSNELRGIDTLEPDVEIKYEIPPGKTEEVMRVEIKTAGGGRFTFKKPMSEPEKRGFMANLSKQASQLGNGQAPPGASPASWDAPPGKPTPVL